MLGEKEWEWIGKRKEEREKRKEERGNKKEEIRKKKERGEEEGGKNDMQPSQHYQKYAKLSL